MASAERSRHASLAWLLALAAPVAAGGETAGADAARVEPELLEFLAEEPGLDDELSEALMTKDLDRAIERAAGPRKVGDDVNDPQ